MAGSSTTMDRIEAASDRGACYAFLARAVLNDPEPALVEALLSEDGSGLVSSFGWTGLNGARAGAGLEEMRSYLAERAGRPVDEVSLELATSRTRLFRGISRHMGPPPPYEAVYRSREGDSDVGRLLAVHDAYSEFGLGLPEGFAERPDHLGLELDVMRHLCGEEARLLTAGDELEAERVQGQQRRFLREHLLRWAPAYCAVLARDAGSAYYSGLAHLMGAFLAEEASILDITPTTHQG